jgi:acetoin utilization protein AcuB
MFVRNHMTKDQAMTLMREKKIRRLPVVDHGKLVGIVVEKDMLSNQPSPATTLSIHEIYGLLERLRMRQIMTSPVYTVEGDCPLEEAARVMVENKIGCLPVMDGESLVGIITETDIFKAMMEFLGGAENGIRLTVRLPEQVGALANVVTCIADAGGNIVAATTSRLYENQHREVTIKESGAEPDKLEALVRNTGADIIDMRSGSRYQPRVFG